MDYPGYADRKAWEERVAPEMKEIIIRNGEKALTHIWKPDLASDYLAFKRTGEIRTGRANHRALQALTLAELVEGKGRFMDAIIDGTWFLCKNLLDTFGTSRFSERPFRTARQKRTYH